VDATTIEVLYRQREDIYKRLRDESIFALEHALVKAKIKYHSLSSRIKLLPAILDKAERKEMGNPLSEMTDIVGVRVVCLFLSDIERIGEQIHKTFDVLQEDNKIEGQPVSSFGYMSVHFVVRIKKDFTGPRYEALSDAPLEIQVRTIAMDAWAAASHHLDYKTDVDVPRELRRDFYALSGLFYVADRHFEMFAQAKEKAQRVLQTEFQAPNARLDVELNLDSLVAYMKLKFPERRQNGPGEAVSKLVRELRAAKITTIKKLDQIVDAGWSAFLQYEQDTPEMFGKKVLFADVAVVRLLCSIVSEPFVLARETAVVEETRAKFVKYRRLID
jgi:putative GTP pyrophosphokinase